MFSGLLTMFRKWCKERAIKKAYRDYIKRNYDGVSPDGLSEFDCF